MPYKKTDDLPDKIKNHLPSHAQDIYLKAFNNAWEEYSNPEKRRDDSSQEAVASKVAWAAVEKKYHKNSQGKWVKNKE